MSIVTKLSDTLVKVSGSVSSVNASAFEEELFAAILGQDLTIDAENLTYISSAGLRVLLKAKKNLKGQVVIENVSPEVYEILDMTGFTEILTVRKALRQICVDGLKEIGHGQNGHVYRIDPDTIVKVFRPNIDYSMVQNEIAKAKSAFMMGIPTAISYDVVKVGQCFGVVYELLNAKDLAGCMKEDPEHLEDYVRMFASVMREMHSMEISSEQFPSARATTLGALPYTKGRIYTEEEYEKVKAIMENVPERKTFIHGDCHAGNVMLQGNELMFIDLAGAGCGHPIFDLMSMYLTGACHQGELFQCYTAEEAYHIWKVFLSTYLDTEDEAFLAKAEQQVALFSCARYLLGLLRIPDLMKPEEMVAYKAKFLALYDKGIEPLCF
ncbi:MAG: anti-sigma factor antagonist [Lachnospiraceae bacterium]|nr:anti-sigma factor antagonist [Lachnospiraceae bacterium]